MTRFYLSALCVLACTQAVTATSYRMVSLPELVSRADAIVVGTVVEAKDRCRIKVTEALVGKLKDEVAFDLRERGLFREGQSLVFFLTLGPKGPALIYPLAFRNGSDADKVQLLLNMKADPKKYLSDAKQASTADFLELLGWIFEKNARVGELDRSAVVAHLRPHLAALNSAVVLQSLAALQRCSAKEAKLVIPLLKRADQNIQREAVRYLEWAKDAASVGPLCDALDGVQGDILFGNDIGGALDALGDPFAVPALERAIKRGLGGKLCWALGHLGSKADVEILIDSVVNHDSLDAWEGLIYLVRRSNKQYEPWMGVQVKSSQTGVQNKQAWPAWWNANKMDFKLVRTAKEVSEKSR